MYKCFIQINVYIVKSFMIIKWRRSQTIAVIAVIQQNREQKQSSDRGRFRPDENNHSAAIVTDHCGDNQQSSMLRKPLTVLNSCWNKQFQ